MSREAEHYSRMGSSPGHRQVFTKYGLYLMDLLRGVMRVACAALVYYPCDEALRLLLGCRRHLPRGAETLLSYVTPAVAVVVAILLSCVIV